MSVSPRTAAGELPRYFELDPMRFQELCRDLWQMEKEYEDVDVYGTEGQSQRGIDVLATRKDGKGLATGQCKCIVPDSFKARLITDAVDEFLKHKQFWSGEGAKKFALFVASNAAPRQIQDEKLKQTRRLKRAGFKFELWSAAKITNKLRPHPGIVRTYFDEHWVQIICGTGISGLSTNSSSVMSGLFQAQLETLAGQAADATIKEVESLKAQWRSGKKVKVQEALSGFHEPTRWAVLPPDVKATILRFEAQLRLEAGEVEQAKGLSLQAAAFNPAANKRLEALILRWEGKQSDGLSLLEGSNDPETIALHGAFLLEDRQRDEALRILEGASGLPEYHRLRALAFILKRNLLQARLEIQKAIELAGSWSAVVYTNAVVHYFSGISPAAVPDGIPQWPDPVDWSFVKTDDESRGFFKVASTAIGLLEAQQELALEDRRILEAWHIACLANDPEARTEATSYCKSVLERDPGNHRVLAWAVARRLEVDLEPAREALRSIIESGKPTPPEVIVAVACHVTRQEYAQAKALLAQTESVFTREGASELWRFWAMQIDLISGDIIATNPELVDAPGLPDSQLLNLRIQAKQTGNWEPLLGELRSRMEAGSGEAALELCMVLAAQKKWKDAEPAAFLMAERLKTAESIRLACVVLYNARSFQACLDLLEGGRSSFPHAELPNELTRMKIAVQSELGLLPAAVAAAEEVFKASSTAANFVALAHLYFAKGDIASLAILARKHSIFEELGSTELLRLAARVGDQDRTLAIELWNRAMSGTIPDAEVTAAMEIGYRLGQDRQLRPLIERLDLLVKSGEGYVRRMSIDEARHIILAQQSAMGDVYQLYRSGKIPIHLASSKLKKPLTFWFHRLLLTNETAISGSMSAFLRSGSRIGQTIKEVPEQPIRLHADITALLTAWHFGMLGRIESAFRPIVLPHDALVALLAMSDDTQATQPSRRPGIKVVNELVDAGIISLCDCPQTEPNTPSEATQHTNRYLAKATSETWLFADWALPLDNHGQPTSNLTAAEMDSLRTPHSVVRALREEGEISEERYAAALDALGPEHHPPSVSTVARNSSVLCSSGVLEWLATGGVLKEAAHTFRLYIDRNDFDVFIKAALGAYEQAEEDTAWLSQLTERITNGLEAGTYQLLPAFHVDPVEGSDDGSSSLDFNCLKDLFLFSPAPGDVIWIDDRCINRYFQRDGARIIDSLDVVYLLHDRGLLAEGERDQLIHRFRRAGARYISPNKDEITACVRQAQVVEGEIVESHELRTLRRSFAYSLVDSDALIITSDNPGAPVEWAFILQSGAAVLDSLIAIWSSADVDEVKLARADWVIKNLYVPDRGRGFMSIERTGPNDLQLEAAVLAGFLVGSFGVQEWRTDNRQSRRQFLNWIYGQLIRDRFDADPVLGAASTDIAKRMLLQTVETLPANERRLTGVIALLLKTWLEDLPDPIRDIFGGDSSFCAKLGITVFPMVQIGAHKVAPEQFWEAAARAFQTNSTVQVKSDSAHLDVKIVSASNEKYLVVEDPASLQRFELRDVPAGILSSSIAERFNAANSITDQFDLRRKAAEDAAANLAQIENVGRRMGEFIALKIRSLQMMYTEFLRKLKAHEPVANSDFLPEDATLVTQHLRIDEASSHDASFIAKLEAVGATLLDDVGITQTLIRLISLPTRLPSSIFARLEAMSPAERRSIFGTLIREAGRSPIATAHIIRLIGAFAADSPSYPRFRRMKLKMLGRVFDGIPGGAWLEVLKFFVREFWYVNGFRPLGKDVRLAIVWAHADRVFRIMAQVGADLAWVKTRFGEMSWKLSSEFVSGEESYITDIANPDRLEEWPLTLALIAYASEDGLHLDQEIKTDLSERCLSASGKTTSLFRDVTLCPNAMDSFLRPTQDGNWVGVLDSELVSNLFAFGSVSNLRDLIITIDSDNGADGWLALQAVIGDLPVPTELSADIRQALLRADFLKLYERNPKIGIIAVAFAAQHAGHFDSEVVDKTRGWLLEFASAFHLGRFDADERIKGQFLSAAFYLYSRGTSNDRYREIAGLISEIVARWAEIAPYAKRMVDRLVDEIPNSDSRHFWKLQVELRAL